MQCAPFLLQYMTHCTHCPETTVVRSLFAQYSEYSRTDTQSCINHRLKMFCLLSVTLLLHGRIKRHCGGTWNSTRTNKFRKKSATTSKIMLCYSTVLKPNWKIQYTKYNKIDRATYPSALAQDIIMLRI